MSVNQHFLEKNNVLAGVNPVDFKTGANTGDYISLREYGRCSIIVFKSGGSSLSSGTITLNQATDIANADSSLKALNFTRIDVKNNAALSGVANFTQVSQAAANTYALTGSTLPTIAVIDVKAEDLDIANGFYVVRADLTQSGSTTTDIGSVVYVLHEPRFVTGTSTGRLAAPPAAVTNT